MRGGSGSHMRIGCNRLLVTGYVNNKALYILPINSFCPYSSLLGHCTVLWYVGTKNSEQNAALIF
jgi:hypothetical protein